MPSAEAPLAGAPTGAVVCVDVGSTFTKALLVDLDAPGGARVVATAEHRTTVATDVLEGYAACVATLAEADSRAATAPALACSSAGGGLRVAVVGGEELVTAEAGRRVALSSGGAVVCVVAAGGAGGLDGVAAALDGARPDVVLLTGGTDGGNRAVVTAAAAALVAAGWRGPVVVAGNAAAADEVRGVLGAAGVPHVVAPNVVPRIGLLAPEGARAAVREVFLRHVIGGKGLSRSGAFAAMVRGATPDLVLAGVELLARGAGPEQPGVGDVVVVDVGGATTDVHSVVEPDPDTAHSGVPGLSRDVAGTSAVSRTVEGDLGMRWSAPTTVAAAAGGPHAVDHLAAAAQARQDDPGLLPATDADLDDEEALARAAVGEALRRHAGRARVVVGPGGRVVERSGTDLREVRLVVASGGALRHGRPGVADRVLAGSLGPQVGGWQLPREARVAVDDVSLLAAAGLLRDVRPDAAHALVSRLAAVAVAS